MLRLVQQGGKSRTTLRLYYALYFSDVKLVMHDLVEAVVSDADAIRSLQLDLCTSYSKAIQCNR